MIIGFIIGFSKDRSISRFLVIASTTLLLCGCTSNSTNIPPNQENITEKLSLRSLADMKGQSFLKRQSMEKRLDQVYDSLLRLVRIELSNQSPEEQDYFLKKIELLVASQAKFKEYKTAQLMLVEHEYGSGSIGPLMYDETCVILNNDQINYLRRVYNESIALE